MMIFTAQIKEVILQRNLFSLCWPLKRTGLLVGYRMYYFITYYYFYFYRLLFTVGLVFMPTRMFGDVSTSCKKIVLVLFYIPRSSINYCRGIFSVLGSEDRENWSPVLAGRRYACWSPVLWKVTLLHSFSFYTNTFMFNVNMVHADNPHTFILKYVQHGMQICRSPVLADAGSIWYKSSFLCSQSINIYSSMQAIITLK